MSQLVEYGIQTDKSYYRAHVGFKVHAVYWFLTQHGREACKVAAESQLRSAFQPGVGYPTAEGYIIPWQDIVDCQEILIPDELFIMCQEDENTSAKGRKAERIVRSMLAAGLLPVQITAREIKEYDSQLRGEDFLISIMSATIQVKCDYKAGAKERGGTGNLFLQIAECNPLRRH